METVSARGDFAADEVAGVKAALLSSHEHQGEKPRRGKNEAATAAATLEQRGGQKERKSFRRSKSSFFDKKVFPRFAAIFSVVMSIYWCYQVP